MIAVLASGEGTNLQALLDAGLPVAVVGSNRAEAGALRRARRAGLPTLVVRDPARWRQALAPYPVRLVVLAGYLRLLPADFVAAYPCINVHPSLLPAFPGLRAPEQALAYGVRVSGCTVHFVDAGVDSGPIILQAAVPVHEDDTPERLHARIQVEEHRLLPEAVRLFLAGRLRVEGRRVRILPEGVEPCVP
jgi:phosphoribosylglycinamide formyltransferase-1